MISNLRILGLLGVLAPVLVSSAFAEHPRDSVKFELTEVLTVKEFSNLAAPQVFSSDGLPVIVYWPFDNEEIERDGDWRLIGVAVGGFGDIDETPVGVKVWAKPGVELQETSSNRITKAGDRAVIFFSRSENECASDDAANCENLLPSFVVEKSGQVIANGASVGEVSDL